MTGRILAVLVLILLKASDPPTFSYASPPSNNPPTTFTPLDIGGGGYVRGIAIAADGTKVARTDTYGAYWWNGSKWVQLVTKTSLPKGDPMNSPTACLVAGGSVGCGVYDIQIAPSNTNIAYMIYGGYLYKTTNLQSAPNHSWTATSFSKCKGCLTNAGWSAFGKHLDIDPANPNSIAIGTPAGVYYSTNSGGSVTLASGIAPSGTASMLVAFDPHSTSRGSTPGIYAASYGTGVYHTTTGASGTWTVTSGTPATHQNMVLGPDGTVYLIDNTKGQELNVYTSGAWTTKALPRGNFYPIDVAVDPAHSAYASNAYLTIVAVNGNITYSTNSGSSWSTWSGTSRTCTGDIGWLCETNENFMTAGQIAYDPSQSNIMFFSEGIGIWHEKPSTAWTAAWKSQTKGIEQLVSNWAISPPGGNPILSFWDRPVFTIENPASFPTQHGLNYTNPILHSSSCDYAKTSTATVFCTADFFGTETTGYTTNGGGTDGGPSNWTVCPTFPSVASPNQYTGTVSNGGNGWAGSVTAVTSSIFMWALTDDAGLFYSINSCSNWTLLRPSGVAVPPNAQGWGHAYYNNKNILCSDNDGDAYAYNNGGSGGSIAGFYKFLFSGGRLIYSGRIYTGNMDLGDGGNAQIRCVPGVPGDIFYTSGPQSVYPATNQFWECVDNSPGSSGGTISCSPVSNVLQVWALGFGAAKPGGSGYPALFIVGWVNNVFGLYRSDDHAVTWNLLSATPCNSLDYERTVSGDMNTWGTVYVGFAGSSFCYGVTRSRPELLTPGSEGSRR